MFAFNLEPVLHYRKTIEEKKLLEFNDMQRKLAAEEALLDSINREKMQIVEQLHDVQRNAFYASDVSFSLAYIGILSEREMNQQKLVARMALEVEKMREELLETIKDRKIMDMLKEHRLMEFKTGIARIERKAIEEVAVQTFVRKKR